MYAQFNPNLSANQKKKILENYRSSYLYNGVSYVQS